LPFEALESRSRRFESQLNYDSVVAFVQPILLVDAQTVFRCKVTDRSVPADSRTASGSERMQAPTRAYRRAV
jgi:hypothetical protein